MDYQDRYYCPPDTMAYCCAFKGDRPIVALEWEYCLLRKHFLDRLLAIMKMIRVAW